MPVAVSDASVLIHLSLIEHLDLLHAFYDRVLIPDAVRREVVEEGKGRVGAQAVRQAVEAGGIEVVSVPDERLARVLRRELDEEEFARRGNAIFEEHVRPQVDVEHEAHKFVAIETGDYEVDECELEADLEEQIDVSEEHPEVTERLSARLTDYLAETGAKFPKKDPQYDPRNEAQYLESIEQELLPRLEKQRLEFLSPDFDPGNNWWGSQLEE